MDGTNETPVPTKATITINTLTFEVGQPYIEGMTINAAEAKVLNQARKEGISNNMRKAVKDLAGEDGTYDKAAVAKAIEAVEAYDAEYEFRIGGNTGRTAMDPVEREALAIARPILHRKIAQAGHKLKDYREQFAEKYDENLAKLAENEKIVAAAKKKVAEKAKLSSDLPDLEL